MKTFGIVLTSAKYKENNYIVQIFTKDFGKISFDIVSPHSKRAKIKKNYIQPFTILEIEFEHNKKRDIQRLNEARIADNNISILDSVIKQSLCFFLAEVVNKTITETVEDLRMFFFLQNAVHQLNKTESLKAFHIWFLLDFAEHLGIYPADGSDNEFIKELNSDDKALFLLMLSNYEALNRQQRKYCLRLILNYYKYNLPNMRYIKSLDIIEEIFE